MTGATLLLMAGLALQATAPAGPQAPPPAVQADDLAQAYLLFLQGRAMESNGNIPGAIAAFENAIRVMPEAAEVRAELAGLYARQGNAAEAIAQGEAAIASDPSNREAHRILGFVRAAIAQQTPGRDESARLMRQAVGHFEQVLADGPPDPGAELTLGRLYVVTGDYAGAVKTLRAFLLYQPGYPEALMLLAQAHDASGETDEAIAALEEARAAAPNMVEAQTSLGELYERTGRWTDAAAVWAGLGSGTSASPYRLRQATALVNGGDTDGGRTVLVALTRETPDDASAWYLLSQVEQRAGDTEAAEAAARRIFSIDPSDPRGPLSLADIQAARGDYAGVIATLEPRVLAPPAADLQNGVHARLVSTMARALQESGDLAGAVAALETARGNVPGDDELLYELGAAYERAERYEASERTFREVIARDPRHAGALNYLGYALADRGQKLDESVALIERALAIEPGNPSFLDSLGWAYFKLERFADAREPLEQAAAAMTQVSIIQDHLGDLYFQLERYREALGAFDRALAGDRAGIDVAVVTRKRDRARELAGGQ